MSTHQHVIAAAGTLRGTWEVLRAALVPGRARRNQRALSDMAMAKQARQHAAERNDRFAVLTSGRVPTGTAAAPLNVAVADARTRVINQVEDVAGEFTLRLSTTGRNVRAYRPDPSSTDQRFGAAVDWVTTNVQHVSEVPILNAAYEQLVEADTYARNVLGEGPERHKLAAECPGCGRPSLTWDTTSTEVAEWSVSCIDTSCRCAGRDCPCNLPDRRHGMRHVWIEARWEHLAHERCRTGLPRITGLGRNDDDGRQGCRDGWAGEPQH